MATERDWHPDDERQQRVADEGSYRGRRNTEIGEVYNRLQESHKIIAELRDLLQKTLKHIPMDLSLLDVEIEEAIEKYKHLTGK